MHVYYNLNDQVQKVFVIRFCAFITLVCMSLYCITIIAIYHNTYWLIPSIILNTVECIHIVDVFLYLIENNDENANCFLDYVFWILTTILTVVYFVMVYIVIDKKEDNVYQLGYVIFCAVICYSLTLIRLGYLWFIHHCGERIKVTMDHIEERKRLVVTLI